MSGYLLSRGARLDLREIARFSRKTWGTQQAKKYIVELRAFCQTLAETPGLGRPFAARTGAVMRMEHLSHVLFYRQSDNGIVILRIVHNRMLPSSQKFDEEQER